MMARLVPIALLLAFSPVPAWGQATVMDAPETALDPTRSRNYTLPNDQPPAFAGAGSRIFAGTEIAPNATFGVGLFGLGKERSWQSPVTVREVNSRQSRKAAVGFSLRF